ncbi:Uncharacterized protein Fot_40616 [Forsythia ovata]|uniref:Uncharacterized protein n=1 Tax=Forsythia ovata TaxID=205694 RepID=A0ABD1S9H3_9LAMI
MQNPNHSRIDLQNVDECLFVKVSIKQEIIHHFKSHWVKVRPNLRDAMEDLVTSFLGCSKNHRPMQTNLHQLTKTAELKVRTMSKIKVKYGLMGLRSCMLNVEAHPPSASSRSSIEATRAAIVAYEFFHSQHEVRAKVALFYLRFNHDDIGDQVDWNSNSV